VAFSRTRLSIFFPAGFAEQGAGLHVNAGRFTKGAAFGTLKSETETILCASFQQFFRNGREWPHCYM